MNYVYNFYIYLFCVPEISKRLEVRHTHTKARTNRHTRPQTKREFNVGFIEKKRASDRPTIKEF